MTTAFLDHIRATLTDIETDGLFKRERLITTPQGTRVQVDGREVINLCANNYLGLANHPALVSAAAQAMQDHGYGMASVRFICGTQDLHRALEARRYRYATSDMDDLEAQLKAARQDGARHIMIATDGVFSMDGYLARLREIRALADQYDALLMVDDCHATGFMGPQGRGTPAHFGVSADILTGTLGKALGGALGGYIAGPQPVIDLLRQRARPYLFSNALPPAIVAAALTALDMIEAADDLRAQLFDNAAYWRAGLAQAGFELLPGEHPIVPVMLQDAHKAQAMAARLFELGVYVSPFFFPVVPRGQARIRTQMNAALTRADLDEALAAFAQTGQDTGALT